MPRIRNQRPEKEQQDNQKADKVQPSGSGQPRESVTAKLRLARQMTCEMREAGRIDPKTLRIPFTV